MKAKTLIMAAAAFAAGTLAAMDFLALGKPAEIRVDGQPAGNRVTLAADGTLTLHGGTASRVTLAWTGDLGAKTKVFGGMWERTYGDSEWRRVGAPGAPRDGTMPWYFLATDGDRTDGYGVMVQPGAFACWRAFPGRVELALDVRAGSEPVELGDRALALCTLVSRKGKADETPFAAGRAFCRLMCPKPRLPSAPVYGYNDWYCAYGRNTATNFLADAKFLVEAMDALPGGPVANRPFVIVDDGWQNAVKHKGDPKRPGGQWGAVNDRWGMAMPEFVRRVKALNARPGLWYRPFEPDEGGKLRPPPYDPTDPVWAKRIREEMARFVDWGMELVKIDFITYDWNFAWGFETADSPVVRELPKWRDRSRTTAEVVRGLYRLMREVAGDKMMIIGCNAIDHFAAGLFELQRVGDDTSGYEWSRTAKMGPNTLGMRAIHNQTFYLNDGDCVGLVREGAVPWRLNRQWLDLVARSGTALFTSWKRQLATDPEVAKALAEAWKTAAGATKTGEPLDWTETPRPRRWLFGDGSRATYDWEYADATVRTAVSGPDGKPPAEYVPAMISNGRLNVLVDYALGVPEQKPEWKKQDFTPGVFWEGRRLADNNGYASRFGWSFFPQGRFVTRLSVDGAEQAGPTAWSQSLDVRQALVTTRGRYAGGVTLEGEAFVAKTRNVIAVRQTVANESAAPRTVTFGLAYEAPEHARIRGSWTAGNGEATWKETVYARFVTHETIALKAADGQAAATAATAKGRDASLLRTVTLKPGESRTADWFVVYEDDLAKALPAITPAPKPATPLTTYAALRDEHVADWLAYADEGEISVPDARVQALYEMARYHLRCVATEWSIPVGLLASHWAGRIFAFDEMYAVQGLAAAGHLSTAKVATDFRSATLRDACARVNHNPGKPFYGVGARWVWEAVEGNHLDGSPTGYWMDHVFQQAAVAQTMWTYWLYTGDRDYLAQKGYDVIRECALFFRRLCVLDLPDGTSFMAKCTDLERLGPGHERAFMTTCGAITTMRMAADAADALGKDAALAADFRACAERLVASLPERDGRYVAYPGCKAESMGTLAGFYPFRTFDRSNAKQVAAVAHFLKNGQAFGNMYAEGKRICPWYAGTMAMASLRAGNEKYPPVRWLQEAARSGGVWGEYWEINEPGVTQRKPWFMTAAGNVLYAICQLLVADLEGEVHLAAGVPEGWRNYSFRLPTPGGWTVEMDVKGGKLAHFDAKPRSPGLPRPKFLWKGQEIGK